MIGKGLRAGLPLFLFNIDPIEEFMPLTQRNVFHVVIYSKRQFDISIKFQKLKNMINLKSAFTICAFLISFVANAQQNSSEQLKNTTWVQQGYGRYLKIEDSTYTYYNANRINCQTMVDGKFAGRFRVISLNKNELILNPGGIVNYIFRRTDSLPPMCNQKNVRIASYEENFKVFWETFNEHYAFFRERDIDWNQVYKEYLPKAKKINSQKELADMLMEIVKKIGDGHIRLEIPDSLKTKPAVTPITAIRRTKNEIICAIKDKYLVTTHSYNNGVISWGKLKDRQIGYILIKDMNGFANYIPDSEQLQPDFEKKYDKIKNSRTPLLQFDDEHNGVDQIMDKILADIGKMDSLVIDLRFNGGGLETVALKLLSYFVTESKYILSVAAKNAQDHTAEQKYILQPANTSYKGKIFLLLGPNTASAAEIFALGAHHYKNIKTLGSGTAGIFSEILWKELPNSWEFSLSNEIYKSSNGKIYEGKGIPVNEEMNYSRKRADFYNSFYNGGQFTDLALDKITKKMK